MKNYFSSLRIFSTIFLLALSPAVWAQVGDLTRTGDMTVMLNATEAYGVVNTSGSTYAWSIVSVSGGNGTITSGSASNNLVSVQWTQPGTCLLQVIESTATCTGQPVTIQITVSAALMPGTASASQTICYNAVPLAISATAPTGGNGVYTYQWEFSVDEGTTWANVPDANNLTYAPGALDKSTRYRLVQTSGGGFGSVTTNVVTITVENQIVTSPIWHN